MADIGRLRRGSSERRTGGAGGKRCTKKTQASARMKLARGRSNLRRSFWFMMPFRNGVVCCFATMRCAPKAASTCMWVFVGFEFKGTKYFQIPQSKVRPRGGRFSFITLGISYWWKEARRTSYRASGQSIFILPRKSRRLERRTWQR